MEKLYKTKKGNSQLCSKQNKQNLKTTVKEQKNNQL